MGFIAHLRFTWLDSQPKSSNMDPVPTDVHDFRLLQKRCHDFLARYYHDFGPNVPKLYFRSFRSEPNKNVTKSYADSWWYHLEKCLLCQFRTQLRCGFSCHVRSPIPLVMPRPFRKNVHELVPSTVPMPEPPDRAVSGAPTPVHHSFVSVRSPPTEQ